MYSKVEAKRILAEHEDRLRDCVLRGLALYRDVDAGFRSVVGLRSDASNRNDLIWHELRTEFDGETGIHFISSQNRTLLAFGQDFLFRVKKLNDQMRPCNNPTQTSLGFLEQDEPETLLGFEGLMKLDGITKVDLSYRLAGPFEEYVSVYLRCPDGEFDYGWLWELGEALEIPAVVSTIGPPPEPVQPRVRLRQETAENDAEEQN